MFLKTTLPKDIEIKINNAFNLNKAAILSLQARGWADEDRYGETIKHYTVAKYYMSILYVTLLELEFNEGFTEYCDLLVKYDYNNIKKCLACNDIILEDILNVFGFPPESGKGIEFMSIENTFEIEPDEFADEVVAVGSCALGLLGNGSTNLITNVVTVDGNEENILPDKYVLEL